MCSAKNNSGEYSSPGVSFSRKSAWPIFASIRSTDISKFTIGQYLHTDIIISLPSNLSSIARCVCDVALTKTYNIVNTSSIHVHMDTYWEKLHQLP